jgi:hypothetical protein
MRYRARTKSSVRFVSDEKEYKTAINETAKKLSSVYEVKVVEESFITAAEFFLDLHLNLIERQFQIKEIFEVFDEELKNAIHHR